MGVWGVHVPWHICGGQGTTIGVGSLPPSRGSRIKLGSLGLVPSTIIHRDISPILPPYLFILRKGFYCLQLCVLCTVLAGPELNM